MKKENLKQSYLMPIIKRIDLEIENGFAANSALIRVGTPGAPSIPEVEGWIEEGFESQDFDMM
ncbi:hypothetical protein J5U18_13150 [Sphingobacteriaceae bacterium WQ 2009]|uniref:Uncharacterized protein n=2 Tax=Rhinopithecimicrobium faecis TaxID=2820698 RepID=A0A8T4HEC3_9SPHI|nr:hypothetical protein [Sphingobacteriaceae bacterium WQ 2009]